MPKHWVRLTTACNNHCLFCLDADTPRSRHVPVEAVGAALDEGRQAGMDAVVLSGGEASLHPRFLEIVALARGRGYGRVQTITNGARFADRRFYRAALDAGLDELTFSLHGHTAALHDALTATPGSFARLVKGLARAARDPHGPVVNVDICLNARNLAHIEDIVSLCLGLGVSEFDLLHIIPHGRAWAHRDLMLDDPGPHLAGLQRVLRLNRHPRVHVWANRFPPALLEGMEDLITAPDKLRDEVHGRRYALLAYRDQGRPLDCRDADRCARCFVEPFCAKLDQITQGLHDHGFTVWEPDGRPIPDPLPFGCSRVGVLGHPDALDAGPLDGATVQLNTDTAPWLLDHRESLPEDLHLLGGDLTDLPGFFHALGRPLAVSGLPPCLAPGATIAPDPGVLHARWFTEGRLDMEAITRDLDPMVKSLRCQRCPAQPRCPGAPLSLVRAHGFRILQPLTRAPALPPLPARPRDGHPPVPPAPSLPGFPPPGPVPIDPLAEL